MYPLELSVFWFNYELHFLAPSSTAGGNGNRCPFGYVYNPKTQTCIGK